MSKTYFIFKRELKSLFVSPLAYVMIAVFLGLNSFFYVSFLQEASMRGAFGMMSMLLIFLMPLITMRTFAEELKSGTDELLMTSPLRLTHIVAGKYLAVLALLLTIFLLTGQYVFILVKYGSPDWGPIITGYIGLILFSGALASLGVFCSSLTRNQMVAAVISLGAGLFIIGIELLTGVIHGELAARVLETLGIINHYADFDKGVIDSTHVIYYLAFIFLFLFLTVRRLDARRW
ncbi:MAG TPA: ABC transporter permease [bacterium]|nr:ABC transporter permease [bacterium]